MQSVANRSAALTVDRFSDARRDGSRIVVTNAAGAHLTLPLIWLRDNCVCAACRITATGEHRYFLGAVDTMPDAVTVGLCDGVLVVTWTDGHTSSMSADDLARLSNIADRNHVPVQLWSDAFAPERFDRSDILNDADTRIAFLTAALRDGMAIVTGMGAESGDCIRFLDALELPVRDTTFDRLHDVFFRSDGYNVAHTDEALPPHNDFASFSWPPSGQLIHMLVNEVTGGEWVNVDGFKVVAQLQQTNPDAVQVLSRVPIAFREHSATAESWTRAPIVRTDCLGNVSALRFSNQLMQPLSPFDPDVEPFYEAYHLLALAVSDPANQIEFVAKAGTMQFLYGHRILHSRRAFDGSSGARHLQDTYFEFDDVAALLALASGEAR